MEKVIIIVVVVIILGCGLAFVLKGCGTGDGNGNGDENQTLNVITEEKKNEKSQNEEVIIKVEENKIYFGEEECADVDDLTDRINKICSQKEDIQFVFEHEYAIKSTYDEVKQTLIDLEETWGISIDYKE